MFTKGIPVLSGSSMEPANLAVPRPFDALQAITINPAKHIGAQDRVGSLEVGKDADIVVTDGCPFEIGTNVIHVFIDGAPIPAAE